MNPLIIRILIVGLAIGLVPVLVQGTATLLSDVINGTGHAISNVLHPIMHSSGAKRLDGIIHLGLYVIAILLLLRVLIRPRGKGDD
jgi:hypothetical protein